MSKIKKVKKRKSQKNCSTCANLGWRRYMTSPYSGGVDYWCKNTDKEISEPEDVICDDWKKEQK